MGIFSLFRTSAEKQNFNQMLDNLNAVEISLSSDSTKKKNTRKLNLKTTNLTKTTSLKKLKNGFIAIDTETTGTNAKEDSIIEVSAIKFIDFKPVEIFTTLINPEKLIPATATKVNGITNMMVMKAPKFSQIISALNDFLADYPIVAHNAPFDCDFLYASGINKIADRPVYDTLEISRRTTKDSHGKN